MPSNPLIESILTQWQDRIGPDYPGYRGHVYRMLHFCLALRPCSDEEQTKLAIAACFHDIGLWSAHTVDYLPPSVDELTSYLCASGRQDWCEELALMVDMHHKLRPYPTEPFPLVELFRQGDLVDFSLGLIKFGLRSDYVREVQRAIPNQGFHRFLLKCAGQWFLQHPFRPPPFFKW